MYKESICTDMNKSYIISSRDGHDECEIKRFLSGGSSNEWKTIQILSSLLLKHDMDSSKIFMHKNNKNGIKRNQNKYFMWLKTFYLGSLGH